MYRLAIFVSFYFQVQVYNPDEKPDQSAGRIEALVSAGTETLAKIGATVIKSDDNIRRYSIEKVNEIVRIVA